ncbi:MAG: alanine racemase [Fusobacterium sp.]|nr:alanine racemase [Fusobacterium sp.]
MRAWVEIETENLKYNILKLKEISKDKEILGVVKANAYGLGAIKISNILLETGVTFFGVANLEEAIELQDSGIKNQILVLGASFLEDFNEADKRKNIHLSVSSFDTLEYIKNQNLNLPIQLKIDTGMTRLGFDIDDIEKAVEFCQRSSINLKGVFSHLSDSDVLNESNFDFTLDQISKFKSVVSKYNLEYVHISNSTGITNYADYIIGNFVRVGLGMYGFNGDKKDTRLKNVFTLKSKIIHIKKVKKNSSVSYSRKYELKTGETYAVLPLGYADGMKKYLCKGAYVLINNVKCEIIGNICMDMTMIKIPKMIENKIKIGDEVIIINSDIINDINIPNICTWDIMTGLGRRVKRVFL